MNEEQTRISRIMYDYCIRPSFKSEAEAIINTFEGKERHDQLIALRERSLTENSGNVSQELVADLLAQREYLSD
ncbi:MAG: hypothetical protein AAFQ58_11100 [Pseudomonadota bacterium]